VEECAGDSDGIVNEINIESPDIVFSVLPTPEQEYFLVENKGKLNAKIWYGLGNNYAVSHGAFNMKELVRTIMHKGRLRSTISKYNRNK